MLLGIPGDNTYSNYQEAARSLWRQTVLPLVQRIAQALSTWLGPASGGTLELRPDLDAIEALSSEREALWTRIDKATFLTTDEKRAAVGYGAAPTADLAGKANFNPGQLRDAIGRWTGDGGDGAQPAQGRLRGRTPPPAQPKPPPNPTIRNKDLAGKKHPETGIPFDKDGFPDFSGVATKTVRTPHTGDRSRDFEAANRAAGYKETPAGMTWHHHQDGYTMQLVPFDIHRRTGHTGSIGIGNTPGKQ